MAISPYLNTKDTFKTYILEMLGQPVIRVEVTDAQLENVIDLTVDYYLERAEGGTSLRFMTLPIIKDTKNYQLDFNVSSIYNVFDSQGSGIGTGVFPGPVSTSSLHYTTPFSGVTTGQSTVGDMLHLHLARGHLETLNFLLQIPLAYDFNSITNNLHLIANPTVDFQSGILYYEKLDYSGDTSNLWNNRWIKRYAVARTKYQWGSNLGKYSGSMLPGGLEIQASEILGEAKEEIEKLETELEEAWQLPHDFLIGSFLPLIGALPYINDLCLPILSLL